jgi:hypothetical protein
LPPVSAVFPKQVVIPSQATIGILLDLKLLYDLKSGKEYESELVSSFHPDA